MPIYQHECESCKDAQGQPVIHDFFRPMSRSGDEEVCPVSGGPTSRVYSFNRPQEFVAYEDVEYRTQITSARQERRLMKQHGHMPFAETPAYQNPRWKQVRRLARKKPTYFTPAGVSHMVRE